MRVDVFNEFCDAVALPVVSDSDSVILGHVMDLGQAANLLGNTDDLFLVIQVDTKVESLGAATVAFNLASDSTANLATSRTNHITTPAIGKAALTAGAYAVVQKLPRGTYERYLGIWATVAGAALTAGKINAFLTCDPPSWTPLPDGI